MDFQSSFKKFIFFLAVLGPQIQKTWESIIIFQYLLPYLCIASPVVNGPHLNSTVNNQGAYMDM